MIEKFIKKSTVTRRSFLKRITTYLGGVALIKGGLSSWISRAASSTAALDKRQKLIFIAIDALHPKYLELDAQGLGAGSDGNWLTPNIRAFLQESVWYKNAKCFLPAATDMNHLNAMAGTSSGQTGIISVWAQPAGWNENGDAIIHRTSMAFARDDQGRPVDTLFSAWKRRWPDSKTLLITGKEWVGEMFRKDGSPGFGIDILVTGPNHPDYLKPPEIERFAHPDTPELDDGDYCDPVSGHLGFFAGSMRPSNVMTRLYTGQGSLLTLQMEHFAEHFPHDRWIVDSTLEIFKRENPDLAYILLAECDDAGHCIGSAWDPTEFVQVDPPYEPPEYCDYKSEYQLVSRRNKLLFKTGILNAIRNVDTQFGRLMKGLQKQGVLDRARVVLLSDHSAVNHLYTDDFSSTDVMALLTDAEIIEKKNVYAFSVSSYGVLYWRDHKEQIPKAKELLLSHRTLNPQTGTEECPWFVLDRNDMKNGMDGVCLPGELYHSYYIDTDREKTLIWPDLIILGKNGWQIPVYNGHVPNVGIKAPSWAPPWRVYNGGHGSVDTLPIVAAISVPEGKKGILYKPIRIADLGVTAASLFGLTLNSTTIGTDLSKDILY